MDAPTADRSLAGKLRRRLALRQARRPLRREPSRPMISFSFDDIPASAAADGAHILEEAGARGVFYVCAGLADQDGPMGQYAGAEAFRALAAAGHEIGCHTYSHLNSARATPQALLADVARNRNALSEWSLPAARTFAFPFGDVSGAAKRTLEGTFQGLRAIQPGLIHAGADRNQLPAIGIEGPDGERIGAAWIHRAEAERAWVILYSHDVSDAPSPWGCTPTALARLVEKAQARGFEIVTIAEGIERLA